jgi:SRSO17 transposase
MGFQFELVWADRLYGESKVNFVNGLDESKLPYSRLVLHTPDLHITPMP